MFNQIFALFSVRLALQFRLSGPEECHLFMAKIVLPLLERGEKFFFLLAKSDFVSIFFFGEKFVFAAK